MKVSGLGEELKGIDGELLRDETGQTVTLKQLLVRALTAQVQGEQLTGEDKFNRGVLAHRIHEAEGALEHLHELPQLIVEV